MNRAEVLVVGAAPAPDDRGHYARLIARADTVIAADGGLLTCLAAGRVPDLCIGDFDSTPDDAIAYAQDAGAEIERYPTAKDVSDLDLAIGAARGRGHAPIVICAAFSGRIDHTLTSLGTLVRAADLGATAAEPEWTAVPLDAGMRTDCRFSAPEGTVVSVLAFGGAAVVSAEGFEYPLDRTALEVMSAHGLSNVSRGEGQSVRVHSGAALVIINCAADVLTLQPPLASTDIL